MGEFRTVTYEVHNPKIKQNQSVRFAVLADVHGSEFGTYFSQDINGPP